MSSVLLKPAGHAHLPGPVEALSFEGQLVSADDVSDHLIDLDGVAYNINQQVHDVSKGVRVSESLSNIVDKTIATFGEDGVTEDAARIIQVSTENLFRAAGIPVPASLVVPSFESGANYSTELKDNSESFIKRIMTWLANALKSIVESLTAFWNKLTVSAEAIEEYATKVKAKVGAVKGELKDPKAVLNLGGQTQWMLGKNDQVVAPDRHLVDTVARYEDFVTEWGNKWKAVVEFPLRWSMSSTAQIEDIIGKLKEAAAKTVLNSSDNRIEFIVNHYLEFKGGKGDIPLLSATTNIVSGNDSKSHMAPILTKDEMKHGIDTAVSAMNVMKELKTKIDVITNMTDKVSKLSKSVNVSNDKTTDAAELRKAMQSLSKACSISAWGWTTTIPYFLKTVRAGIRYIDISAGRYS
jgi:hypothetical protein